MTHSHVTDEVLITVAGFSVLTLQSVNRRLETGSVMADEKKAEVCSGIPLVGPENTL